MEDGDNISSRRRTPIQEKRHSQIIEKVSLNLLERGFALLVDHISWPQGKPPSVHGSDSSELYKPDIFAMSSMLNLIVEVKTVDTINSPHTIKQLVAFDRAAKEMKNGQVQLILPTTIGLNSHLQKASELKIQYKLSNTTIYTYNFVSNNIALYHNTNL